MTANTQPFAESTESFAETVKRTKQLNGELAPYAEPPTRALVELTNGCNHACIFCKNSHQSRRANFLSLDTYASFIDQALALGLQEVGLYATGEPFMNKQLPRYIEIAKKAGVNRVYLTSNGALATLDKVKACHEAGLDSIKYSINASNATDYKLVHGFDDFDVVEKNVRATATWRQENAIDLQMLCSCVIIPSISNVEEEHRALFAPLFDDLMYVNAGSQGGQAFELIEELGVSPHGVFNNMDNPKSSESIKPCYMVWNRYHLTAEGYLTACCIDYELDLVFADLNKQKLSESWNNESALQLRTAHLDKKLDGLLCNQCLRNQRLPYKPLTSVSRTLKPDQLRDKAVSNLKERIVYTLKQV